MDNIGKDNTLLLGVGILAGLYFLNKKSSQKNVKNSVSPVPPEPAQKPMQQQRPSLNPPPPENNLVSMNSLSNDFSGVQRGLRPMEDCPSCVKT